MRYEGILTVMLDLRVCKLSPNTNFVVNSGTCEAWIVGSDVVRSCS